MHSVDINIADHPLLIGGAVVLAILLGFAVVFGRKRPGRCADPKEWDEAENAAQKERLN